MQNKFFTFISPYLSFIDKGHLFRKPFGGLYALLGIFNLLLPLYLLYQAANNRIFETDLKVISVFMLIWLVFVFAGWISFQLWWGRMKKISISSPENAEFVATPVFAHLIQTLGEWLGTWIAIVGFGTSLLITVFGGLASYYLMGTINLPFVGNLIGAGAISIIISPLTGFLIIVVTRFMAEQFKALSAIANNTKKENQ